jgi:hypothetical protein
MVVKKSAVSMTAKLERVRRRRRLRENGKIIVRSLEV